MDYNYSPDISWLFTSCKWVKSTNLLTIVTNFHGHPSSDVFFEKEQGSPKLANLKKHFFKV